jgi:hypothetical protein
VRGPIKPITAITISIATAMKGEDKEKRSTAFNPTPSSVVRTIREATLIFHLREGVIWRILSCQRAGALQDAVRPAVTGCLGLMEARMIEGRHIDHAQLLQLGKVLLLLVEREELLVNIPVVDQLTKKVVPIEELSRAS